MLPKYLINVFSKNDIDITYQEDTVRAEVYQYNALADGTRNTYH